MSIDTEAVYDRLLAWQRGEKPGPWRISLYPTYRCNIECKICWKRAFDEPLKPSEELSDERILEMVDEAGELGVKYWTIGGGGELMLRRKLVMRMAARIRELGMNGTIQSNGTIFSDKHIDELIDMQWDQLHISLDGPTQDLNEQIRVEGNWEKTYDFLQRIQKRKKERGATYPVVSIVSVLNNVNYDKMHLFVDLAEELELAPGDISCVDLIVYGEHDRKFLLTPEQKKQVPELLEAVQHYARTKGVNARYHHFLSVYGDGTRPPEAYDLFTEPTTTVTSKTMCYEPFTHLVVVPEGNGGPCCTWHDLTSDNIREHTLEELWHGPYMNDVREKIMSGNAPSFCSECMPTVVATNQKHQTMMAHLEQLEHGLSLGQFINKAGNSLKKHGLSGSIRRGREWLEIRNRAREKARSVQR